MSDWRAVVEYIQPKNQARGSEDIIVKNEHIYTAIDGVSSGINPGADTPLLDGLTPGQFAAKIVGDAMLAAARNFTDARTFVTEISQALKQTLEPFAGQAIGQPACTFVAFLPRLGLIIRVGDGPFMIDDKVYGGELAFDRVKSLYRADILKSLLRGGMSAEDLIANDPTREQMDTLTQTCQPRFTNSDNVEFGYGVINGDRVPRRHIEVTRVPADAQNIVLASDGFPDFVLRPTLAETITQMEALMERDPLCITEWVAVRGRQPGGGWPDDTTYVRFIPN